METNRILETRGVIIKEERVKSLKFNILENSLVLENTDAFPGYFGKNQPDTDKPRSLFIIIDKKYDGFFLARTLKAISNKIQSKCYSSYGELCINEKVYYCIRIKNLDCFPSVLNIQLAIQEAGIGIMKYQHIDDIALIKIHKSFVIQAVDEGIFIDIIEPDRYYISIPNALDWEEFKRITLLVKSNIDNNIFDAALGYIWRIDGLMDMVRIYEKDNSVERINTIRDRFLAEIKYLQK